MIIFRLGFFEQVGVLKARLFLFKQLDFIIQLFDLLVMAFLDFLNVILGGLHISP